VGEMTKLRDGKLVLGEFLPYRLSILSNRISGAIAGGYEDKFQITVPEWRVMAIVGGEANLSAGEVADRTAMDKVAVSRAVSKLLEKGHLVRHFAEEDKRRSVLALSTSGNEMYQNIIPIALGYEEKILEGLTQDERDTLDKLLNKLMDIQLHAQN